ncbi:MAG: alginate lyase family protein [Bacteroidaceae bacterium]|nr:alginate lyase family protein [Bacteroidaceae bacterium]
MKRFFFLLALSCLTAQAQTTDRGFIHPGGLHTQADFDRVKQLIKDKSSTAVTQAYQKLKSAGYSQSSVQTYPVETIVRGGGSGENYINAARGATMAYQNALRWKIDGTRANAEAAVRILMAWATTTKVVTGNSDAALAVGLYGYQFAQAAELMRDYDGWAPADFEQFRQWMLTVWYPGAINFLRYRNGTWENSGKWWQAPGHYWSNWGLCNILCVISIGILCDDVYIYNQGMSFFKYDQVGTFTNPPTLQDVSGHGDDAGQAIFNTGLTDYLGNLVVTDVESPLETAAYGRLGQMNESGRDTGHSAMALGLAIDIAKIGWNQGDDLFAYMDHRLASGIEYVAAQTQSVEGLPWTNYLYGNNGYYYTDSRSWLMTGPALGAQMRPYWGTVVGIYEGVKGVRMPYSEVSLQQMGIDGGGEGGTSGGYDHMGYSVLMNTRVPQLCPADQVPTELTPQIISSVAPNSLVPSPAVETRLGNLSGKTLRHNEMGGLVNTFSAMGPSVPTGRTLTLSALLPEGEEDTGLWQWNTGQQTREISVETSSSFIYRVTYTNSHGIQSQQCFPIACQGDGDPIRLTPYVTYGGETLQTDTFSLLYGKTATLKAEPQMGGGKWKWSNNKTTQEMTTSALRTPTRFTVTYTHTNGVTSDQTFRLGIHYCEPYITQGETTLEGATIVVDAGTDLTIGLRTPTTVTNAAVHWNTGETGRELTLTDLQATTLLTATFDVAGQTISQDFHLYVRESERSRLIEPGNYVILHTASGRLLTSQGKNQLATFLEGDAEHPTQGQVWYVERRETAKYNLISLPDSLHLNTAGKGATSGAYPFYLWGAQDSPQLAIYSGTTATTQRFWSVADDGQLLITQTTQLQDFPFLFLPVGPWDAIEEVRKWGYGEVTKWGNAVYDLSGRRLSPHSSTPSPLTSHLKKGLYIVGGRKVIVR